jgi:hypothetical protein
MLINDHNLDHGMLGIFIHGRTRKKFVCDDKIEGSSFFVIYFYVGFDLLEMN